MKISYLVGIDEAGRGPLAGPVAVGVCVVRAGVKNTWGRVKDSKQLSPEKREEWFRRMCIWKSAGILDFAVSFSGARSIDRLGIVSAISSALARSLKRLKLNPQESKVLLDGGLRAPDFFKNQKTIIRGDEKESLIALASIAAKVLRDRRMIRLARVYPLYDFHIHKGYGTAAHRRAIRKHGLSAEHRRSFCQRV